MNELRWILAAAGVVLLLALYLFSRRRARHDEELYEVAETEEGDADSFSHRVTPSLEASDQSTADEATATDPTLTEMASEATAESASSPLMPEKIIALHLVPRSSEAFDGSAFLQAVRGEGLSFGRFEIFHRYADGASDGESLFSVANLVKPGSFNLQELESQQLKGASMFLVLPGPADPVASFADMLATGRRLAATLEGQLVDSHGTAVSRQSASHLREEIINYQHGMPSQDSAF